MAMPASTGQDLGHSRIPLDRLPNELITPLVLADRDQAETVLPATGRAAHPLPLVPPLAVVAGKDEPQAGPQRDRTQELRRAMAARRARRPRRKRPLRQLAKAEESPSFYLSLSDLMSLLLVFFVLIFSLTNPLAAGRPAPLPVDQATAPAPAPVAALPDADPLAGPEPLPQDVTRGILAVTGQGEPDPGLAAALAKPPKEEPAARRAAENEAMSRSLLRLVTASRPVALAAMPQEDARLSELLRVVKGELGGREGTSVEARQESVLVRLEEAITFDQGRAELKPEMRAALTGLAGVIAGRPEAKVVVSGHTDDMPIATAEFPSNWELSAARAATVARALMAQGADPARFTIRGQADQRPLASNDTPLGRQLNRRVEIELWPGQAGQGSAG